MSGATVSDAIVTVLQETTNLTWTTVSGSTGRYAVAALPPGTFRVEVRRQGFKTALIQGVRVDAGQVAAIDVHLALGELSETIHVAAMPVTETGKSVSALAMVFESVDTARLPANGGNYLTVMLLAPGVTATNPQSFTVGQRMTSGGRPYVNGNRKETNSYLLDGVDINQSTDNVVAYLPSPDALESVVLTTATASAEWGNYLGGIVAARLKSGTNMWHGSAFGFVRDEALNATNWARNWQPLDPLNPFRKTPMNHWTAGGTLGGPVVRNRLFAFGDYQRVRRETGPTSGLQTVATEAMRQGNFAFLLRGSNPQQLFDPFTTRPDPTVPGRFLRDPFPGNLIPRERFNPVAAALFAHPLYPLPDFPGDVGNAATRSTSALEIDQGDFKLDGRVSDSHTLTARLTLSEQRTRTDVEPVILPGSATYSPMRSLGGRWATHGASKWANEASVGFTIVDLHITSDADGSSIGSLGQALGIAGVNDRRPGLPSLGLGGVSGVGNPGVVQDADVSTLQVQNTVTWIHLRHTFKAGGLVLRSLQESYFSGNTGQMGIIEFNGQYTRDLTDPRSTGFGLADFILGYPSRAARGDIAERWQHETTLFAGFVQSDWRARADLTLNLGLRYEYRTPLVERHDRQVTYDLRTGAPRFAGREGNSRALYEPYANDWQPRIGIAWQPRQATGGVVLRGAFGISGFQEGTGTNLRLPLNPPFFNEMDLTNRDPAVLGVSIDRGFEGIRERDPLTGSVLRVIDPNYRPARSEQWHVTLEWPLASRALLSTGYVGQRGQHLAVPVNANQASEPGGDRPLDPYLPQIGNVVLTASIGKQQYDALQTVLRKPHGQGWSLIASHTWGHAFSDSRGYYSDSGQSAEPATFWPNPRDQAAEWGSSAFDARHHVSVGWTLDLPWGRERRWASTMPSWLDAIAGGWSVDGLWRAHSGFAITVLAPDQSRTGARSGRPDRIGSGEGTHQVGPGVTWFDTTAFTLPALGTFGNAGTGIVRGPGLNVVDLAVSKQVRLPRRSRLEFRVEAYNAFNTPVFDAPDRNLTSSTFGQVRSSQLEREVQLGARWVF